MLATNNNYYYQQTINEQVIVLLVWFAFQRGWAVKKKCKEEYTNKITTVSL